MEIRRLGAGDITEMRALNALFAEAFEDPDSYLRAPPDDGWLARVLAKPDVTVLAIHDGADLAGGLVAYTLEKLEQRRSEIYIYDLAVAERFRRRGAATALIGRLQDLAAASGAWVIFVQADHDDPPAVALYESLGAREEVLHFDIPLKGSPR